MSDESPTDPEPAKESSLSARLRQKYGRDIELPPSLDPVAAHEESLPSSELLQRLSQHTLETPRYALIAEIARGGMGAILKVRDEDLRRNLAMKVMLAGPVDETPQDVSSATTVGVDPRLLARFLEEAQVTGQLDHPGVVPVHELGLDAQGHVYFTMRLVKGRDLKHIFDLVYTGEEGWNQTRALGVLLRVCEAMAYAHKKGVVHRDLKPANVMVGSFGEVYVMDWGLARVIGRRDMHDLRLRPEAVSLLSSVKTERRDERALEPDSPIVTMDGDVMGTPCYMAPEQARGEVEELGPRSDVYSLGSMLYHLLARHMPFVPRSARMSNRTVLAAVISGPPRRLTEIRKDLPAELVAICEKAMAREALARYSDMSALAEDLRAYLEHRVVTAYETGALAELKKWIDRNRGLAAASAAAVLLLVVGLAASSSLYVRAEDNARKAQEKAEAVLRLSALQDLDDLVAEADRLWPAEPSRISEYESWLGRAHALLEGRDPREGLAAYEKHLAELRARALPWTKEQREAALATHPRAEELQEKKASLAGLSDRLAAREHVSASSDGLSVELSAEEKNLGAEKLNALAWTLVDHERTATGQEARGLALARLAVERSRPELMLDACDTLAWALFANGFDDEALARSERARDAATDGQKDRFEGYVAKMRQRIEDWGTPEGLEKKRQTAADLAAEVAAVEAEIATRHDWTFADSEDRWWHNQLEKLVEGLKAFADETSGVMSAGASPEHGWGVKTRLEFARSIEDLTLTSPTARRLWSEAIASIHDRSQCEIYGGLALTAQLGLLPIGRDPRSNLWEFAHLATGEPANRGSDGRLVMKEDTGLIFVLVPGGRFEMGAQHTDASGPNYDPQAQDNENPPQAIELAPYFLSKYEMTQGQWLRFTGRNPSLYGEKTRPGDKPTSLLNPVERVSWEDCSRVMHGLGLELPTEAQWEYAARAGTSTSWWTGDDRESLLGAVNIYDIYAYRTGENPEWEYEDWLDDGYLAHAPVGSFRANAFGLHDVLGNVNELCRDRFGYYDAPVKGGTGERQTKDRHLRVSRGGSFNQLAPEARCACRNAMAPDQWSSLMGLRPARVLSP